METDYEPKQKSIKLDLNESEINGEVKGLRAYSRNSFDRFGDDLCELLVSYLTFKDKIVLEKVCNQWKRCVYNRQRTLRVFVTPPLPAMPDLSDEYLNNLLVPIDVTNFVTFHANSLHMKTLNKTALKTLLMKCKFIKKLDLTRVYIDPEILYMIGKYCPLLESLHFDIIGLRDKDLVRFGQKYGKRMKNVRFNAKSAVYDRDFSAKFCHQFGKKFLFYCTNIKSFTCEDISAIADSNPDFLPKLEAIDVKLKRNDYSIFVQIVNKYELKIKKLKVFSNELNTQMLKNIFTQIARFREIQDLNMSFAFFPIGNSFSDKISEIAKNCPKLKRLSFKMTAPIAGTALFNGNVFESFGKFTNLNRLYVAFHTFTDVIETVECFKRMTQLTHLVIKCSKVGDSFFKDIGIHSPKLRLLSVTTESDISNNAIESISKLTNLTKLHIGGYSKPLKNITDSGLEKLLQSCHQLREMSFYSRPYITTAFIEKLISFATKKSKSRITFFSGVSRSLDEQHFPALNLESYKDSIPDNLKITIRVPNDPLENFGPAIHAPQIFPPIHVIELNLQQNFNNLANNIEQVHQLLIENDLPNIILNHNF